MQRLKKKEVFVSGNLLRILFPTENVQSLLSDQLSEYVVAKRADNFLFFLFHSQMRFLTGVNHEAVDAGNVLKNTKMAMEKSRPSAKIGE